MQETAIPITSRVERARGRNRREALNVILPRLFALNEPALPVIATSGPYHLREMQHAGLTIWFTWIPDGLNVVVLDGTFVRKPNGAILGSDGFPPRVFSITFDPNNLAVARPMGWMRGDWEARIFQPVAQ